MDTAGSTDATAPTYPYAEQQEQTKYSDQPQEQPPYPVQPQQAPYPQQAYPAPTGYALQPAYPPQGYAQPVLTSEAPPPYFPDQQPQTVQQSTNNAVVVMSQPTPVVHHTVYRSGNSEYGLPAIIFAVAITICFLSLGCWYAILCSAIGIALGVGASSSASNGDMEAAKQYNIGSLTCTVISLVSAVIPIIAFVIWIATL